MSQTSPTPVKTARTRPRRSSRSRLVWIAGIVAVSMCCAAGMLWAKRWLFPAPLAEAASAYARNDFIHAERLARRRMKAAPGDDAAMRLLARATARLEQHAKAISIYSRIALKDMAGEDYFLLGRALSRTGDDDSALKSFEAARDADPGKPEFLNALAEEYQRMDLDALAESTAERLAQQPGWEVRGQLMLGLFRTERNDHAGAALALRRAFELDPSGKAAAPSPVGPFQKLLVRSLLRTRQPGLARRYLEQFHLLGSDAESGWLASRCFLQEQDWEHAAGLFNEARSYRQEYPKEEEPAFYVGAARCASCHEEEYRFVLASRHGNTFARGRDLAQSGIPFPAQPFADPGDPKVVHTMKRERESIRIESRVGGTVLAGVIRYAFGSPDKYVTFTGPDVNGRPREFRISYFRSPRGSGWDLSTGTRPHPANREEFLGQEMAARDGERRCVSCHTTNFRAIEDQVGPESADHSIGCEGCHGPGGHHLLAVEAEFPDLAIISPKPEAGAALNQLCGRCHGMELPRGFSGEPDDPGWFRFELMRLQKSRCYTATDGQLNCVTCHDPHKNAESRASENEARCLSCHKSQQGSGKSCPINPVQGCIQCHMTRVWREQTHSYKFDHFIRVH